LGDPVVGIVMGSDSDLDVMNAASEVLLALEIPCEMRILSAHRTPDRAAEWARNAEAAGLKVIIAGAGLAAHLAGAMAAHSDLPVIGVPLAAGPLAGFDALLSTVQMPGGVPVATVAIGKAGARNAAWLAARILALSDDRLRERLREERLAQAAAVEEKDRRLAEGRR
jgi:phosphoribosylaminoimidazole carboxylase PurE protein